MASYVDERSVRDFYERAYQRCRINDRDFPSARDIQELVQARKLLRKWRRWTQKRNSRQPCRNYAKGESVRKILKGGWRLALSHWPWPIPSRNVASTFRGDDCEMASVWGP